MIDLPPKGYTMCMQTTLRMFLPALLLVVALTADSNAATMSNEALQRQLEQQSKRIDRLEAAVQELQSQAADPSPKRSSAENLQENLSDPLVGTWECTNKVFTYNMTFFADGLLLQESTTFGPMREVSWRRLSAEEILLTGGIKLRTSLSAEDQMTAENLANRAQWECRKLTN
jgi:hypothetical protein